MSVQHNEGAITSINPEHHVQQCECPGCVEARKSVNRKKFAVVAVASGQGLVNVFKEMGVDYVVEGLSLIHIFLIVLKRY